jgi:hypothetical protein
VEMYDHSGISLKAYKEAYKRSVWDSSIIGIIYTTKDKLKEMGIKNNSKKIEEVLIAEIELYNKYINGNVYQYSLYEKLEYTKTYSKNRETIQDIELDLIDSIGGIYEDYENNTEGIKQLSNDYFGIDLESD